MTAPREIKSVGRMMMRKFPEIAIYGEFAEAVAGGLALFRIVPEIVSILDYRKGFGHTELFKTGRARRKAQTARKRVGAQKKHGRGRTGRAVREGKRLEGG